MAHFAVQSQPYCALTAAILPHNIADFANRNRRTCVSPLPQEGPRWALLQIETGRLAILPSLLKKSTSQENVNKEVVIASLPSLGRGRGWASISQKVM